MRSQPLLTQWNPGDPISWQDWPQDGTLTFQPGAFRGTYSATLDGVYLGYLDVNPKTLVWWWTSRNGEECSFPSIGLASACLQAHLGGPSVRVAALDEWYKDVSQVA